MYAAPFRLNLYVAYDGYLLQIGNEAMSMNTDHTDHLVLTSSHSSRTYDIKGLLQMLTKAEDMNLDTLIRGHSNKSHSRDKFIQVHI